MAPWNAAPYSPTCGPLTITRRPSASSAARARSASKPVAKVARSVGGALSKVTPNVADQMREMNAALDVTLVAAGDIVSDSSGPISTHESEDILQQASLVAEQKLKERFPTTPVSATAERDAAKGQ